MDLGIHFLGPHLHIHLVAVVLAWHIAHQRKSVWGARLSLYRQITQFFSTISFFS